MTPLYIAGPCVIETEEQCRTIANEIKRLNATLKTNIIFKASFDKANRTSFQSYRGPGIEAGLEILSNIKKSLGLNITTDIHETWQADKIAEVADVIQIPAFLCRQTDLIRAASETGKIVNIKKGQFMSGDDMKFAAEKARHFGCREVWLTERGNSFGYNNLIVDFRNISIMKEFADRVIMDCTHCSKGQMQTTANLEETGNIFFHLLWQQKHFLQTDSFSKCTLSLKKHFQTELTASN